jgi:hypothetical protein
MALGLVAALVCATLVLTVSPNSGASAEPDSPGAVRLTKLRPVSRQMPPFNGEDSIAVPLAGEKEWREVEVALRVTRYQCSALRIRGGKASKWSTSPRCYELVTQSPFVWASWGNVPRGLFQLVEGPEGTPFLKWVTFGTLVLAELRAPCDRAMALQRHILDESEDTLRIPVSKLIPDAESWGVHGSYIDAKVVSINKHDEGLAVRIADPYGFQYVLVGTGSNWRLEE